MAIFHYTIKIVGRSKGKSVISASAYLNGDVMKNEETGRISYYTSKKEVVYTRLMMCENAPPEWQIVPEENIKRFQKSVRYKRSEDKEAALKKFKITFQKQRLWNEVLKIEKNADAQLGRSFEFALPKEEDAFSKDLLLLMLKQYGLFLDSFQFACKNFKGNDGQTDIAKTIGFESNDEYNEIMFLREITHTINAFNEMADIVRLYSKKPKTAEQRLANLLSEVLYEDSESV
jgi:hypothetical protein